MKLIAMIFTLMSYNSAFALKAHSEIQYDLKMDLSMNGGHVASPRIIVNEGEIASVSQKTETSNTFVEVIATKKSPGNPDQILLDFKVGTIDKDGVQHVLSRPRIVAVENEEAEIEIGNNSVESANLSLKVIAKKVL